MRQPRDCALNQPNTTLEDSLHKANESGRGLPQSKTRRNSRSVLECGSPLPLSSRPSLFQFFNLNLPELDTAVVALQEDRARFGDFVVDFRAGRLIAGNIVVNLFSVHGHRYFVADDGRFNNVPFARGFGREGVRLLEVIDRAIAALARLAAREIIQDLDFMTAA